MSRTWRTVVGVMGSGSCDSQTAEIAREVGRGIAERGAVLLCGGRGGVMDAAAQGAREAGGLTIGILPGRDADESRPNPSIDVAVFTGLGYGRNYVNACASDVVIAIAGLWGTLSEIALAKNVGRPVILLHSWERVASTDDLPQASTAEDAVRLAFDAIGGEKLA